MLRSRMTPDRRATVLRHSLFAVALAAAGCGGGTGSSTAGEAYLAIVPAAADLTPSAPGQVTPSPASGVGQTSQALSCGSGLLELVFHRIEAVERQVSRLTHGLDEVRSRPPTSVDGELRIWGPAPVEDRPGLAVRFVLAGEETPESPVFRYAKQFKRAGDPGFVTVVRGTFRGERAVHGTGEMEYLGAIARELELNDEPVVAMRLGYAFAEEGARMGLSVERADPPSVEHVQFAVGRSGGGELLFEAAASLEDSPTPAPEQVGLHARWLEGGAGRIDARVRGGDLGGAVANRVECFNEHRRIVFEASHIECGAPQCDACGGRPACGGAEGNPELCVIKDQQAPPPPEEGQGE
ncbi:MAG: hypothetical protein HYZ28_04620 [Myxococcales bacterium]|nr:hypothetical protein [Myxococcales bacterium]